MRCCRADKASVVGWSGPLCVSDWAKRTPARWHHQMIGSNAHRLADDGESAKRKWKKKTTRCTATLIPFHILLHFAFLVGVMCSTSTIRWFTFFWLLAFSAAEATLIGTKMHFNLVNVTVKFILIHRLISLLRCRRPSLFSQNRFGCLSPPVLLPYNLFIFFLLIIPIL